jgi:uncharacterized protein (TIGR03437 family)
VRRTVRDRAGTLLETWRKQSLRPAGLLILLTLTTLPSWAQQPSIAPGGIVPLYSSSTTIQPGEWVSIYGGNLASQTATWIGNFPTSLGGTSVKINGKLAYLWYVSPTQINLQAPDDTATGTVPVVVTTPNGSANSTVTLGQFGPSFSLLDGRHVAGIILRPNGSGAYGGGSYDIIGPTGSSLGYRTVAAQAGDEVELFAVGLGPTSPAVPAGKSFSGAAPTTGAVRLLINNVSVAPSFAGLSSAGLYQLNLSIPLNSGTGDVPLSAIAGGAQTPPGVVISLQAAAVAPHVQSLTLSPSSTASGGSATGSVVLTAAAPSGGAVVSLSSSSSAASVPGSITVPAGATSATFAVSAATVISDQTATITASYGGTSAQAVLTVTPPPPLSFSSLVISGNWNIPGYPALFIGWTLQPNNGVATFTVTGADVPTFGDCTASNGNTAFTCTALSQGLQIVANAAFEIEVSSGSLAFTLTPPAPSTPLGTVTGTLSVTGSSLISGGAAQTYSGSITGSYVAGP